MLLLMLFFGSINLLGIGHVGEYLAKIFEEVKRRPLFIRRASCATARFRVAGAARGGDVSRPLKGHDVML